jgi:hypothetical protein
MPDNITKRIDQLTHARDQYAKRSQERAAEIEDLRNELVQQRISESLRALCHDNSEVATKKALTDMIARHNKLYQHYMTVLDDNVGLMKTVNDLRAKIAKHNKLSQQEDMLIELMKTVNDLRAKIDSMYKEKYKNP